MKKCFALLLALVMVLALAACGSSNSAAPSGDDASAPSVLVMGTSPDYPPYEFYADAALTEFAGIDVEVGKYIADAMGMELQIEAMNFDNLVTSLGNGDFDMVLAACEYTEERANSADFSDPYYTDLPPVILVKADNAAAYTSEDDINKASVIIGAQKNTTKAMAAADKFDAAADGMVLESVVGTLITELKSGQIDLLVLDGNVGVQYADQNDDLVVLEGVVDWGETEPYRVLVQKGDPKGLLPGINAAIAELTANDGAKIADIENLVAALDTYIAE
ncbi:MAG: transporter substrate-binding domain-containing protein [Oscillospiraceae bacterium]|nr:transporter substrate-binding domain-containing protein [Oscillospiraceae bacterium]